jgi:hypothetical protein
MHSRNAFKLDAPYTKLMRKLKPTGHQTRDAPRHFGNVAQPNFKDEEVNTTYIHSNNRYLHWIIPYSELLRSAKWFKTDISGLPLVPISNGQADGTDNSPETSVSNTSRREITQKTEDFSSTVADAYIDTFCNHDKSLLQITTVCKLSTASTTDESGSIPGRRKRPGQFYITFDV